MAGASWVGVYVQVRGADAGLYWDSSVYPAVLGERISYRPWIGGFHQPALTPEAFIMVSDIEPDLNVGTHADGDVVRFPKIVSGSGNS